MGLRFLLLCLVLVFAAPVAYADAWSDAKREFRSALRSKDWKTRREAYLALIDYESADCVREILTAALKEQNGAVVREALKTLGTLEGQAARDAILVELSKARGTKATYLLMALARQDGPDGVDALLGIFAGKDPQRAALAALALGAKAEERSLPALIAGLENKSWQVVGASARALEHMAWSAWTQPTKPTEGKKPAMPAWFDVEKVLWPLIDRLEVAEGPERGDLVQALETITKKDYGWNVPAWAAHAKGEEPDAATLRKRKYPPHMFGVPLYGRRIVIVMDANVLTDNVHPFTNRERLKELCKVPGRPDLPWFKIKTIKEFHAAHVRSGIRALPKRGQKFELIFSGKDPKSVFGKLIAANAGNQKAAIEDIAKMKPSNGNDILTAMTMALDVSGSKDAVAWQKGPDEILCVYSSVPWEAEVTEAVVVGSAIGLKAGGRMVKIHAVGVHEYAYEMLELFSGLSGGRYVALIR